MRCLSYQHAGVKVNHRNSFEPGTITYTSSSDAMNIVLAIVGKIIVLVVERLAGKRTKK
jgi:hypothetical protein